jgi:hypothetical protein
MKTQGPVARAEDALGYEAFACGGPGMIASEGFQGSARAEELGRVGDQASPIRRESMSWGGDLGRKRGGHGGGAERESKKQAEGVE